MDLGKAKNDKKINPLLWNIEEDDYYLSKLARVLRFLSFTRFTWARIPEGTQNVM